MELQRQAEAQLRRISRPGGPNGNERPGNLSPRSGRSADKTTISISLCKRPQTAECQRLPWHLEYYSNPNKQTNGLWAEEEQNRNRTRNPERSVLPTERDVPNTLSVIACEKSKFSSCPQTNVLHRVHSSWPLVSIQSHHNQVHTPVVNFCKILFNNILSCTPSSSSFSCPFRFPNGNFVRTNLSLPSWLKHVLSLFCLIWSP